MFIGPHLAVGSESAPQQQLTWAQLIIAMPQLIGRYTG
jgi:hypothetical protein